MDLDRYITRNEPAWKRLEELTRRARSRVDKLDPIELDELIALYQRTSSQLSHVRGHYHDRELTVRLTRIVASAAGVIYGKRARSIKAITDFFSWTFPAAVWQIRRFIGAAALIMFVPAVLVALWLVNDPAALDSVASPAQRSEYVENQFEQYYSDQPSAMFFTEVTVNNITVSFQAFALATLACVPGAWVLVQNGLLLGQAAAVMITAGETARFFGLIIPHGALELTAIAIAAGAGLKLGWTLLVPGDRTRPEALTQEGRRTVVVILGLMTTFVTAGLIEGFVTGSGLPTGVRIGVGLSVWTAFAVYIVTRGRLATSVGITGALGEAHLREALAAQSRPVALTAR